jgi:hypothetical protein
LKGKNTEEEKQEKLNSGRRDKGKERKEKKEKREKKGKCQHKKLKIAVQKSPDKNAHTSKNNRNRKGHLKEMIKKLKMIKINQTN